MFNLCNSPSGQLPAGGKRPPPVDHRGKRPATEKEIFL